MIHTFIEDTLTEHNSVCLKSALFRGLPICVWTYDVNKLNNQVLFGIDVKDAREILPFGVYKEIQNRPNSSSAMEYFKFIFLYDVGGCFVDPTILFLSEKIKSILETKDFIFGDDRYYRFLLLNKLCPEVFSNFINMSESKSVFSRNVFYAIEHVLFKEKNPRYFDYTYRLQFDNGMILSGNQFLRDLWYNSSENKIDVLSNNQISLSCCGNIFDSEQELETNINIIESNLLYLDIRHVNFINTYKKNCPLSKLLKETNDYFA